MTTALLHDRVIRLKKNEEVVPQLLPVIISRQKMTPVPQMLRSHHVLCAEAEALPPFAETRGHSVRRFSFPRLVSQFAVLLIVPVLIFRPLLPLYAADDSVAQAGGDVPVSTSILTNDSALSVAAPVDVPAADVLPTPVDPAPIPVTDQSGTSTDVAVVATEVLATTTDLASPLPVAPTAANGSDTPAFDTALLGGAATDTQSIFTDASTTIATEGNSETPVAESSATTTAIDAPTDPSPLDPLAASTSKEETKEEVIARELEGRTQALRESLKKEVEAEVFKGCLTLDGVGYYCLKDDARTKATSTIVDTVTSVHADLVAGSLHKQIIAERGSAMIVLSHNDFNNAFPTKDVSGTHVVWQTQENGRWQVYYADLSHESPVIEQVTHGTESNFNPRVDGERIVWQGWADGNWEIFMAEKLSPSSFYATDKIPQLNAMLGVDNSWHVVRLTQNSVHDMFPSIAGGLVTWQSFEGGVWSVFAYSVATGQTTKLSADGTKSENPHFAVTWEERQQNGDTRMVGYDLATGNTVDMTKEARNVIDDQKPYVPETPRPDPTPLALPGVSTTGSTTPLRTGGDDAGTPPSGNGTSTETTL